jgi:hypothetical protein
MGDVDVPIAFISSFFNVYSFNLSWAGACMLDNGHEHARDNDYHVSGLVMGFLHADPFGNPG